MILADVFLRILNMSFTGAVVALIVMFVRIAYRMLPKKYLCILWMVMLIRLLCPFTFPELGIGEPIQEPIPSNIMEMEQPYIASEIEVIDNTVNRVLEQNFTPEVGASVNPMQIVMAIGSFTWIAGIAGMLILTAWKFYRFHKWIREAVPDKSLGKRIYRGDVTTPVVVGVLNPRIYLPYSVQEPQLSHVLIHENMHIKRKDHLLKLLFYIAVIIHWFNPMVWISYRLLERDMEMACDEAVLERLGAEEKKNYCESLLNLADSKNHFVGNPVAFGESDVKMRMKNVLNYKKPRFWLSVVAVVILLITTVRCLNGPEQGKHYAVTTVTEMTDITYPLTKEVVELIFAQVDLPGMVTEEEYDSAIRTSIDIRDEENRLIAGIASTGDGDARWLGITLIPYLHSGAASIVLPEEKWEELISFATLLYGFEDQSMVYRDFIESYEGYSIHTEYQRDEEPYYKDQYEWIKTYGNVTCVIEVCVATDETKDIQTINFYNSPEYSATNSEMAAKNFMFNLLTSIPGRYETYLESGDDFPYLNRISDRVTEKCLDFLKEQGYVTLMDEYADQAGVQLRFTNAVLTEVVNGDKDVADYLYRATLIKVKDDETKEFTVDGEICVVNMLNGWKVDSFRIDDTEALRKAVLEESNYELATEQVQPQETEHHKEVTEEEMLEIFQTEYGWTDLANQQLFWDETNGRVVINYYFEALADEWQMDSAREYGFTTFVLKRQNSLGGPHAYQLWAYPQEITEVVIQVFCNGIMTYQDIYGGIEDRIVYTESHYGKQNILWVSRKNT